ncbi:hypothetical protein E6R18_23175 [Streptomyces sp. A1277]|uniref:hypothetical protein n=1 Tax=Streptomyces sp. A1277 TaxID=2563103 RepID=UPI0010A271DB|nr:hypothetical protein [Streptomyces sp. A1277]THA29661.1 hypothetical protein E6R18_23175 [Streptomyces sp. A1277]
MPSSELQRINSFLSAFARRQAERVADLPGGFAVYDDGFAHSRANNQVIIDKTADPGTLPAVAEEALGHLPHRLVSVLDDDATDWPRHWCERRGFLAIGRFHCFERG